MQLQLPLWIVLIHRYITLLGRERTHWSKTEMFDTGLNTDRSLASVVNYGAKKILIHTRKQIWQKSQERDWDPIDDVELPFDIEIPENLPTDIRLYHADITYELRVTLDRQGGFFEFSRVEERFPIQLTRYLPLSTLRTFSEPYEWTFDPLPPHPSEIDRYEPADRHGGVGYNMRLSCAVCGPSDKLNCDISLFQGHAADPAKLQGVFVGIKMYKTYRGLHEATGRMTSHTSTEYIADISVSASFDSEGKWQNTLSVEIPKNHPCCTTFSEFITVRYKAKVKVHLVSNKPIRDLIKDKEMLLVRSGQAQQQDLLREINNMMYERQQPPTFEELMRDDAEDSDREITARSPSPPVGEERDLARGPHGVLSRTISLHERLLLELDGTPMEAPPAYQP